MSTLPQEKRYSYADLLEWDEDVRYELYDGIPMAMASPTDTHQEVSRELCLQLGTYLRGKTCSLYYAPFDVRLFEKDGDRPEDVSTVVQPDLMVVCDRSKIDRHGVHGAPDLVIEILSESSFRIDRVIKLNLYQRAGVQEYWIVDPLKHLVRVHTWKDGSLHTATYTADSSVPVGVLDGCSVDLRTVFPAL